MTTRLFSVAAATVAEEIVDLLTTKRHDYGPSNLADFGVYGILIRMSDKFHRLKTLMASGEDPLNESIADTWMDIAGYAILALMIERHGVDGFVNLKTEYRPAQKPAAEPDLPMPAPDPMYTPGVDEDRFRTEFVEDN
jgi:hypothetical protein